MGIERVWKVPRPRTVVAIAAGLAGAIAGLAPATPASAVDVFHPHVRCGGRPATHVAAPGQVVVLGTPGPDVIVGNAMGNVIHGFGGDDTICGGFGHDRIFGGNGDDVIHGGFGDDWLWGGPGRDSLYGELGDDHLTGGAHGDRHLGGPGNDVLDLVNGDNHAVDYVDGGIGHDRVLAKGGGFDHGTAGPHVDTCTKDFFDPIASCELLPPWIAGA